MRAPEQIGEFVVEDRLGEGGMGVVYRVVHGRTGARHALKLLTMPQDAEALRRFTREGQALAAVDDHPNIVRVHTAGEWSGRPYLVMQLCTGGDLKQRLRAGPLPPREAARIVADVARGIAHVHTRGIIHRDLKPENVLFDDAGQTRVGDFGVARVAGAGSLTTTGAIMGTPAYMAPEQAADGRDVDARADVWGLGALLIAALTGRAPYSGGSPIAVLSKLMSEPPRWPSIDRPDTPPALERIVRHAMARTPEDRYATAALLADDLERFLAGELDAPPPWSKVRVASGATLAVALVLAIVALTPPPVPPPEVPAPPPHVSPIASPVSPTLAPAPAAPRPSAAWRVRPPLAASNQFVTRWTVKAMVFLDARHLLLAGADEVLLVDIDAATGESTISRMELPGVASITFAGGVIHAGTAVATLGRVRVLEHEASGLRLEEAPVGPPFDGLLAIACSADGEVLAVMAGTGDVHALSLPDGKSLGAAFDGPPREEDDILPSLAVSADGQVVACGYQNGLRVLRLGVTGLTESSHRATAGRPKLVTFSAARTVLLGTDVGSVQVFEVDRPGGEPVLIFDEREVSSSMLSTTRAHTGPIRGLAVVGTTLLSLSGGEQQGENLLRAWDLSTREPLWRMPLATQLDHLAVSPDGRRYAVSSTTDDAGGLVEVWTAEP